VTLPIYPSFLGLAFNVKWTPTYFNQTVTTLTGASITVQLAASPLHTFELTYDFLRDAGPLGSGTFTGSEIKGLMGFFEKMQGSAGRFLFLNPDDNNVLSQPIATFVTGGGAVFPLVRTFGDNINNATEPVGMIKNITGFYTVYFAGVPQVFGTNYVFNVNIPGDVTLNLITLPGSGTAITADFTYYYYCRFLDDNMTFEKFLNAIWQNQSVKIITCRPGA
jgi:hypothetical protein